MNISTFTSGGNLFVNCECVKSYAFQNAETRGRSVLLPVICAVFGLSQDCCAHLSRIECLLPRCPA